MPRVSNFSPTTAAQAQLAWVVPIVDPTSNQITGNMIITLAEMRALMQQNLGSAALASIGTASGNVPTLDVNGQLAASMIPPLGLSRFRGQVADQAARLGLTNTQIGDWVVQSDTGRSWILAALPASTDGSWVDFGDRLIDAADIASGTLNSARLPSAIRSYRPIVSVTASKTLTLPDMGTLQAYDSASSGTITVPNDSTTNFDVGAEIDLFQQGTGSLTIAAASGVTVTRKGTGALQLAAQKSPAHLKKMAANTWELMGDLV